MKIITQSGTSKILPKPQISASSGGPPVVMVNTGQSTAGSSVLPRTISTYTGSWKANNLSIYVLQYDINNFLLIHILN